MPEYSRCRGSWRPDFLVDELQDDRRNVLENFRITEINARYPLNGFMHIAYGQQSLNSMGLEHSGLMSATDPQEVTT